MNITTIYNWHKLLFIHKSYEKFKHRLEMEKGKFKLIKVYNIHGSYVGVCDLKYHFSISPIGFKFVPGQSLATC
jgi:hypothetical protein